MNRLSRLWAAAAVLSVAAPLTIARAQSAATTTSGATDSTAVAAAVAAGPTLASASVAVRPVTDRPVIVVRSLESEAAVPNALPAARTSDRNATTLMIVGGAAFIAGAIIGDTAGTIIMVGGAGVGLYGLYLYLQ